MDPVATRLKRLRQAAHPAITIRRMAELLELESSSYNFYETPSWFKKPHLPLDLARRVARILADHGVNPDDVLALAGVGTEDARTATLSAGEEQLLGRFRKLDPDQRRLLQQLADAMGNAATAPASNRPTVQSNSDEYRVEAQR